MKAILTVGISASGKSCWAREYAKKHKAIISNRDDLRFSLTGCSGWGEYKFDKKIETVITNQEYNLAYNAAQLGKDFIVSNTNLNETTRNEWVEYLKNFGYEVEINRFPITLEEAWKRDSLRVNGVGRDVIYKQWKQWLKFIGRKQYVPDESLPKAVMFDIDGTLAHMDGKRGPFEREKVGTDTPDKHVVHMSRAYAKNYRIVFLSGRDGICAGQTVQWLEDYVVEPEDVWNLYMRDVNDTRKDTIVKEEIFWRDIAPYYDVQAVVDDRPSVCRMWRDVGIPKVIQVGDPHEEF